MVMLKTVSHDRQLPRPLKFRPDRPISVAGKSKGTYTEDET